MLGLSFALEVDSAIAPEPHLEAEAAAVVAAPLVAGAAPAREAAAAAYLQVPIHQRTYQGQQSQSCLLAEVDAADDTEDVVVLCNCV